MRKILITGFTPMDGQKLNASQELVESMVTDLPSELAYAKDFLFFNILKTNTYTLNDQILELISSCHPEVVLCIGQAVKRSEVTFERIATNARDFRLADGEGNVLVNERIEPDGPAAYWSTLSAQTKIIESLIGAGIPSSGSNFGGNSLCNQVLYHVSHYRELHDKSLQVGFMHIPILPLQVIQEYPAHPSMPLTTLREALRIVIELLLA